MKCMPKNLISAVSASSENANYPATNVLSSSQLVPWIATTQVATLTLTVPGGANGVGLVEVKAMTVGIVVKDGSGATVASTSIDMSGVTDYLQWMANTGQQQKACGFLYPYQMAPHTIEITVDSGSASIMPEIGRAGAGGVMTWRQPQELTVSQTEIGAIEDQFYDGGRYYVPGQIVKTFSGSIRHDMVAEFWQWVNQLGGDTKTSPCFWWVTDQDNVNWLVFARFSSLPSSKLSGVYATTSFELIEDKG